MPKAHGHLANVSLWKQDDYEQTSRNSKGARDCSAESNTLGSELSRFAAPENRTSLSANRHERSNRFLRN